MSEKADFYSCPICKINFETQKCPRCGRKGVQANPPFERDLLKDASYLDYIMKKDKKKDLED